MDDVARTDLHQTPDRMIGSVVNLAGALAMLDGDRELLGELVSVFLQECPGQLASVRDVGSAVLYRPISAPVLRL